jgi:hypothetical protein
MIKNILNFVWDFLHAIGRAKAASHFARIGDYKTAQAIMNAK